MNTITEYDFLEQYDEMLNECYPDVTIGYGTYSASAILRECDPIVYRVGASDYADMLAEEGTLVEGYTA